MKKLLLFLPLIVAVNIAMIGWLNSIVSYYIKDFSPALSPSKYKKNSHTKQAVSIQGDEYLFSYQFKDHKGQDWLWEWGYNKELTDSDVKRFGIPKTIFEPYQKNEEVVAHRIKVLESGFFHKIQNNIYPNYNQILEHYSPYTKPLYTLLNKSLGTKSKIEKINFAMKFSQDIPYGIPPRSIANKYIGGVLTPPQILTEKWGDCDSKALLFTSMLSHEPNLNFVFLHLPKHMLVGVEGIPKPYQHSIRYKNKDYIYSEPVGPGRREFGSPIQNYENFSRVEEIKISHSSLRDIFYFSRNPLPKTFFLG